MRFLALANARIEVEGEQRDHGRLIETMRLERAVQTSAGRLGECRRDALRIQGASDPSFQNQTREERIGHSEETRFSNVNLIEIRRILVEPLECFRLGKTRQIMSWKFSTSESTEEIIDQQTIDVRCAIANRRIAVNNRTETAKSVLTNERTNECPTEREKSFVT